MPRILIVDDERPNRDLLEAMLAPEGYCVESTVSGEEALARITEEPPDLILLDGLMPHMDGYELTARIKANPATRDIPIIMISGSDESDARLRMLRGAVDDFLPKPVDRADLCARVRMLLRFHPPPPPSPVTA